MAKKTKSDSKVIYKLDINAKDNYKDPVRKGVFNFLEEKPVPKKLPKQTFVQPSLVLPQQTVPPVNLVPQEPEQVLNALPNGYGYYRLYGRNLDPERYGYAESFDGHPVDVAQFADTYGLEKKMNEYKKNNAFPWKMAEGGGLSNDNKPNLDLSQAKTFNEAFKLARQTYGANHIFEYQGRKYGTNLAGEEFKPSEDTLTQAGLNNSSVKRRLESQNKKLNDPFLSKKTVKLEPDEYKDWEDVKQKKIEYNKSSNADLIIKYKQKHNDGKNYVIVDKKKGLMHIYQPTGKLLFSSAIDLGANVGDAQTVTKVYDSNNDGVIDSKEAQTAKADFSKGNKSTGAGKFYISNIDKSGYEGLPLLNMMNERQYNDFKKNGSKNQVSTSFHTGYIKDDKTRVSNGCIRCNKTTLDNLVKNLQNASEVYILPEDKGNEFVYENGKLNFKVKSGKDYNNYIDSHGKKQKGQGINRGTNSLNYIPVKTELKKGFLEGSLDVSQRNIATAYAKSLEKNKQKIMKAAKINGDVYNDIAKISFGILGVETNYGQENAPLSNLMRAANKWLDPKNSSSPDYKSKYSTYGGNKPWNSVGLTQMRWTYLNKDEQEVLKKLGIKSNKDFMDPEKAALGTTAILAVRYNQQLSEKDRQDLYTSLPKKWNTRANYPARVKANSQYLNLYEKNINKFANGGSVDFNFKDLVSDYLMDNGGGLMKDKLKEMAAFLPKQETVTLDTHDNEYSVIPKIRDAEADPETGIIKSSYNPETGTIYLSPEDLKNNDVIKNFEKQHYDLIEKREGEQKFIDKREALKLKPFIPPSFNENVNLNFNTDSNIKDGVKSITGLNTSFDYNKNGFNVGANGSFKNDEERNKVLFNLDTQRVGYEGNLGNVNFGVKADNTFNENSKPTFNPNTSAFIQGNNFRLEGDNYFQKDENGRYNFNPNLTLSYADENKSFSARHEFTKGEDGKWKITPTLSGNVKSGNWTVGQMLSSNRDENNNVSDMNSSIEYASPNGRFNAGLNVDYSRFNNDVPEFNSGTFNMSYRQPISKDLNLNISGSNQFEKEDLANPELNLGVNYGGRNNPVSFNVGNKFKEGSLFNPTLGFRYNFADGGTTKKDLPDDFNDFLNFHKTLPENLQDPTFEYGNPNQYDLYGFWESLGKSKDFNQAIKDNPYWQPDPEDGMYHGFSVNATNGVFLKPANHPTTYKEVMMASLNTDPYFKENMIIMNEDGRLQYVPRK